MKVLVTGANGLLGQHLVKQLLESNYTVLATGRGVSRLPFPQGGNFSYCDADITNEPAMYEIISSQRPEAVIHAAAMTQVDDCEKQQDACFDVNVRATAQLLLAAEQFSKYFLFVSTDFVFDGRQGNYKEDDALNPVSWYGFTKMQAEGTVETSAIPWAIVRTCLVYGNTFGGTRGNIVNWVKGNLEREKAIHVVNDQFRSPTYVEDLARGIILAVKKAATGIYHISGKDLLTPYEIAVKTAQYLQLDKKLIFETDASVFTEVGHRPPKTGLDITKAKHDLGFVPLSFEEGLERMFG